MPDESERWRILREKLQRLAQVSPDDIRTIEAIVDELLEGESQQPRAPKKDPRKGNSH